MAAYDETLGDSCTGKTWMLQMPDDLDFLNDTAHYLELHGEGALMASLTMLLVRVRAFVAISPPPLPERCGLPGGR